MEYKAPRPLAERLVEAERHVSSGERLLERQRAAIEERRRDGHDVELANELLTQMQESQFHHIEDRDRLRRELAEEAGR